MSRSLLICLTLVANGCTLISALPPQIEVASVELRGVGLLDQQLEVGLCAFNPNDRDLAFRRVTIGIDVAGMPLADGISETVVRLPPHQSVLVPFAVAATIRNLGPQLVATLSSRAVPYRLHGTVQLAGSLALTVPFSRAGRLDLLTAAQPLFADPGISSGPGCGNAA